MMSYRRREIEMDDGGDMKCEKAGKHVMKIKRISL